MLSPKKKHANQYTVKRDRSGSKAAKPKEAEAEKQDLPSIAELSAKRNTLTQELAKVEKQIQDVEERYVQQSNPLGNAVTGYEGLLTGVPVPHQNMRLFSGSSVSGSRQSAVQPAGAAPA